MHWPSLIEDIFFSFDFIASFALAHRREKCKKKEKSLAKIHSRVLPNPTDNGMQQPEALSFNAGDFSLDCVAGVNIRSCLNQLINKASIQPTSTNSPTADNRHERSRPWAPLHAAVQRLLVGSVCVLFYSFLWSFPFRFLVVLVDHAALITREVVYADELAQITTSQLRNSWHHRDGTLNLDAAAAAVFKESLAMCVAPPTDPSPRKPEKRRNIFGNILNVSNGADLASAAATEHQRHVAKGNNK